MSDTIREQIIQKVDLKLKEISILNGYLSNLGYNIYQWRSTPLSTLELPALIYRDITEDISIDTILGYEDHILTLELQLITQTEDAQVQYPPSEARKLIGDIYKAIGTNPQWDGLAMNTMPLSDDMDIRHEEKIITGNTIRIAVNYRTKTWNPYEQ